jgi:hypothetical protein
VRIGRNQTRYIWMQAQRKMITEDDHAGERGTSPRRLRKTRSGKRRRSGVKRRVAARCAGIPVI